jgi:5-hydroxyisourate hydrolase
MKVSTHVLNTAAGKTAPNVKVTLVRITGESEEILSVRDTNSDGRCQFDFEEKALPAGIYRVSFETDEYFNKFSIVPFFTNAEFTFRVPGEERNYHIALSMTPFAYSTYLGS